MDNNKIIKPKIDDQFWFDYSLSLIGDAVPKREKAAEVIQKLVLWFWGVYTATATVGFALSDKNLSILPTIVIASASASLIAVYWCTAWILMPILVEFDPRSPTEISEAHKLTVESLNRRIKFTVAMSLIAAVLVSLSIILASISRNEATLETTFKASIFSMKNGQALAVTANVGQADSVMVHIRAFKWDSAMEPERVFPLAPMELGFIQTSIPLTASEIQSHKISVEIEWENQKGVVVKLSKEVKIPQQKSSTHKT